MSNIGRKKPDENFEKQLHRTLSRYGKKSKRPTILRPYLAAQSSVIIILNFQFKLSLSLVPKT